MRFLLSLLSILFLCSCSSFKVVEVGMLAGIKVKESVKSNYPIIFGKLIVYDKSNNLSAYRDKNISDMCLIFVGNDPMIPRSMFYRYNYPNTGQRSTVYRGIFAIQLNNENLRDKNLNISCGTEHYARKISKLWLGPLESNSSLRLNVEKPLHIKDGSNKAIYLGDIEIIIPNGANIFNAKTSLGEAFLNDLVGNYYLSSVKQAITHKVKIKDNFEKTSKEIMGILPFIDSKFDFDKDLILH